MRTRLLRAWVPALLWLAVIALESTPMGSSESTSRFLLPLLTFLFGKISVLRYDQIHYCLRKAGHFFGYAVLSLVMFRAWWAALTVGVREADLPSWRAMFSRWSARAALLAILSTAIVAGLDEWHQAFIPGRGSSAGDVLLDSLAGVFTQLTLIVFSSIRKQRTPLATRH